MSRFLRLGGLLAAWLAARAALGSDPTPLLVLWAGPGFTVAGTRPNFVCDEWSLKRTVHRIYIANKSYFLRKLQICFCALLHGMNVNIFY